MFPKKSPEVLIAGAGPVGLWTALVLARRGVRVQLVDKEWRTGSHSYALALHAASLQLLAEMGLLDAVLPQAYRVQRVALYEGAQRRGEICLDAVVDGPGCLAVMPQNVLEQLFENILQQLDVPIHWNHEISQLAAHTDGVSAVVDQLEKETLGYAVAHTEWTVARSKQLNVPYVIGADGHRSMIRRALGSDFEEFGQPQHFAVFEFRTDADLNHEMCLIMDEQTTNVLWPVSRDYCRWSFQLLDFAAPAASRVKDRIGVQLGAAQYPLLTEESLHRLISERAPWFRGKVEEISWRIVVRFERRLATSFGRDRLWLAGDAGHMTGPVGMQSMNVGFREAQQLAEALAGVLRHGESPERLQHYSRERLAEWRSLLGLQGGLRPGPQADPWIAARCDRLLPCIPASGGELRRLAEQLGLQLV